jgi:arylsulfatase A-like enzyme
MAIPQQFSRMLAGLILGFVTMPAVAAQTVVEFFDPDLNNFFITADPTEQTFVDSGAVGRWQRTGNSFSAGGPGQVCRFYGNDAINPATGAIFGPNSHFYTANAAECAGLKAQFSPVAKSWKFESNDFLTTPAVNNACAAGLVPVYRAYNNGFSKGIDSNHRITSNFAAYRLTIADGWIGEGVVMCAPNTAQPAAPIPSTFFAVSAVRSDYPKVSLGTLGHQEFAWGRIEQTKGTFNFQLFDSYMASAQKNGLIDSVTNTANMVITLAAGTPPWALADQSTCSASSGGTTICAAPPDNIQDWIDFLTALIQHYDGKNQPHVKYYELWNEFNIALWWTGTDAQLVALAKAAYPIIHQDPYSQLLTPSVAGPVGAVSPRSAATRMTQYLQAGGAQYADAGAYHGYIAAQSGVAPFPMPEDDTTAGCTAFLTCYGSTVTRATQMRAVFDQGGLAGKPMLQTEGSWGNDTLTNPDAQIAWVTRYSLLHAGLAAALNLQMNAWFTWGGGTTFGWGDIETATLVPNLAGLAYTEVYHWIVGATIGSPCAGQANGTWTCTLTRPGGYVAQAVWNTKGATTYAPGAGFVQYRDLTGTTTPITAGGAVPIGAKPVLIEGSTPGAAGAPNIVLVLTDDQDVQTGTLSYMPNVKALLADQGVSFSNALVPLSLCCPSRTTMLRGQFPHNTGVLTNALPDGGFERAFSNNVEATSIATLLHGAGYRTVLLGKYLNGYPDTAGGTYIPPGWDEWYSPVDGDPYSEFNYTLNENGTKVPYRGAATDYMTDVLYGKAADFIQRAATKPAQPLFIYFATYAPHSPYTPAPRHANLFSTVSAPRPPSFNETNVADKPAYIRTKPLLTQAEIAAIDEDYRNRLRSLQAIDEAVAGLVAKLAATGRLANTYIIFASDNGYHMGEHRLLPGKYTPYETDIHVPLIIRGPGAVAGAVRDQFVGNLDLAPTFADLAGVTPPPFFDGRSLKSLLQPAPPAAWRQAFLLEEFGTGNFDPVDASVREPLDKADKATIVPIPSYYGFKTPAYKYVEYATGEKELYLASDTDELRNLTAGIPPSFATALSAYMNSFVGCAGTACRLAETVPPPALPAGISTVDGGLAKRSGAAKAIAAPSEDRPALSPEGDPAVHAQVSTGAAP